MSGRKECDRRYREKHRDKIRQYGKEWRLKQKYGLTEASWRALFDAQGKRCAICGTEEGIWHTDHNHATGEVRGILCGVCNMGIGLLGDDPTKLLMAIDYLRCTE